MSVRVCFVCQREFVLCVSESIHISMTVISMSMKVGFYFSVGVF